MRGRQFAFTAGLLWLCGVVSGLGVRVELEERFGVSIHEVVFIQTGLLFILLAYVGFQAWKLKNVFD